MVVYEEIWFEYLWILMKTLEINKNIAENQQG